VKNRSSGCLKEAEAVHRALAFDLNSQSSLQLKRPLLSIAACRGASA